MIVGYELGISTVAAATLASYSEFEPNGTRRAYIRELGYFCQTAVAAGKSQIGRPGNTPTGGALTAPNGQDPANTAATAGFTTTWTSAPTAPSAANVLRQFDLPATVGSAFIATYPPDGELISGPTRANSVILWNGSGSTGPIISQYAVWAE